VLQTYSTQNLMNSMSIVIFVLWCNICLVVNHGGYKNVKDKRYLIF